MSKQVLAQKVFLVTYCFNSEKANRMCLFYDDIPRSVRQDRMIGSLYPLVNVFELKPELVSKSFDELLQLWLSNHWGDQSPPKDATVDQVTKDLSKSDFLKILEEIIKTSHHKGERANARVVYERVAGKPYSGKEYVDP